MGRTIIAEDGIEEYGEVLASKKELVVGMIFGQEISATKTCVVHLARSPAAEEDKTEGAAPAKPVKAPSKDDFDDTHVIDHARQVILIVPHVLF